MTIFISEEVASQMELYWSSSLQLELVIIYKCVRNGLVHAGMFFGRQMGVRPWTVPWDNRLAWVKHGGPEAIKIGLGDTREICRLGDGSTLHVVELEECHDHHLVVEWQ
jgi:hypothetical protein